MAYRSFEELEVWKRACDLAVQIYKKLESCRDFGLRDQMQRAAVSIASNIAEGIERDSPKDTVRFLRIAKASAAELRTQLYIAERVEILSPTDSTSLRRESFEIGAMTQGLIKHFQQQV